MLTEDPVTKDPDAYLDYTFDWGPWLEAKGDTITEASVTANEGASASVDQVTNDETTVTVWVSGGELRERVRLVCRVTTAGGRTDDRTLMLSIVDR